MASSNLFKSLYSTDNSIQNSGFTCLNARNESETSFDITNDNGVISDSNGNTLAQIPLNIIHAEDLSQYNIETRILQPYSCYVLQGQEYGLAYTTYHFQIPECITSIENYEAYLGVEFDIIYNQHHHKHRHIEIPVNGSDFTDALNEYLEKWEIEITASIQTMKCEHDPDKTDEYLVLQAQNEGYFFFVKNVRILPGILSEDYPDSPFSNDVDDINFEIVKIITEVHPVTLNNVYEQNTYEVDCQLYRWLVMNHEAAINDLNQFEAALQEVENQKELFDTFYTLKSTGLLENTIYDTLDFRDIIINYDIDNQKLIADIIRRLKNLLSGVSLKFSDHYWLPERCDLRVPMMKYPNGAFRGIVLVPEWPNDSDYEFSTLYINHVQTLVNAYIHDKHHDCYKKMEMGVMSNAMFMQEAISCNANPHNGKHMKFQSNMQLKTDILDGWDNVDDADDFDAPNWQDKNPNHNGSYDQHHHHPHHDDIVYLGESCYSDKTKIMGLYRYMDYVSETHQWIKVGEAYMAIGKDDNHQSKTYNLLPSVMIYNPNPIPVRIHYLIFS